MKIVKIGATWLRDASGHTLVKVLPLTVPKIAFTTLGVYRNRAHREHDIVVFLSKYVSASFEKKCIIE